MKIKLLIEYDGMSFCGWQKQRFQNSVQETLERAIKLVFANACEIQLFGAGRTDTGVHALGQVAHFEIVNEDLIHRWMNNLRKLPLAINSYLRDFRVRVVSAEKVPDSFHARFSATMRHYQYIILNRTADSPIYKNRAWNIRKNLDEKAMNEAAKLLLGRHNFNAFRSSQCCAKTPVRTISDISVYRKENFIITKISAKSFLHNQVRIIVGTLAEIGSGKKEPEYINFLLNSENRSLAGPTAPPYGLYFYKVDY